MKKFALMVVVLIGLSFWGNTVRNERNELQRENTKLRDEVKRERERTEQQERYVDKLFDWSKDDSKRINELLSSLEQLHRLRDVDAAYTRTYETANNVVTIPTWTMIAQVLLRHDPAINPSGADVRHALTAAKWKAYLECWLEVKWSVRDHVSVFAN